MNFNKVVLMGRLTADPELKEGKNAKYVDFSIAVNRSYKETKEVHFFNCRSYGTIAETIKKHFSKGRAILLEGRLDNSRWQDESGKNCSMIRVVVESFEFVDSPKKDTNQEEVSTIMGTVSGASNVSSDYDRL